jgi:hypothetical protein
MTHTVLDCFEFAPNIYFHRYSEKTGEKMVRSPEYFEVITVHGLVDTMTARHFQASQGRVGEYGYNRLGMLMTSHLNAVKPKNFMELGLYGKFGRIK